MMIGITGGIGSGKTHMCEILEVLGIPIYNADLQAKRLMQEHSQIRNKLVDCFGESVYQGGFINRKWLSERIFQDPAARQQVNAIVHPQVKNDFIEWSTSINSQVFGMESAILIESGLHTYMDKIIAVEAPLAIRIQRIIQRDRCSKEQALERIQAQLSDAERKKFAHYVVNNDGIEALLPQIENILSTLQ